LSQNFAALRALPVQARKLTEQQQLQDVSSITLVILLPPSGQLPDFGRTANPHLMTETFEEFFILGGITARFQSDDNRAGELFIK
jgi:hypothetical protein